jgi:hypothetical protein
MTFPSLGDDWHGWWRLLGGLVLSEDAQWPANRQREARGGERET